MEITQWADIGNGLFETGGAIVNWLNVKAIYRDKEVKGVYWPVWIFFSLWGYWNIWYYTALDQSFSWWAGLALVSANTAWVGLAVYYLHGKTIAAWLRR